MLKLLKKGLIILKSRFKKNKETEEALRKRAICKGCEYNTLNIEKISFKKKFIKWLSDSYSKITGNGDRDNLGSCSACSMCSVYYKTETEEEYCPHPNGDKWKQKL